MKPIADSMISRLNIELFLSLRGACDVFPHELIELNKSTVRYCDVMYGAIPYRDFFRLVPRHRVFRVGDLSRKVIWEGRLDASNNN